MLLPWLRLLSVVLVIMLSITLGVPPPADADPMTALAIASAAVVVVILVVYLIVVNASEGRRADSGRVVWLACAGDECRPLGAGAVLPAPLQDSTQSP